MTSDSANWFIETLKQSGFQERYPSYLHVLARLEPLLDPNVAVMAVSARASGRLCLHVSPTFFATQPWFVRGVLLHEVHHIVLGHLTNPAFRDAAFPDLLEIAMEASANEWIQEPLPGEPVVWQQYEAFGLRAGQSTLERYELLAQARRDGKLRLLRVQLIDDHDGLLCNADAVGGNAQITLQRLLQDVAAQQPHTAAQQSKLAGTQPSALLSALRQPATVSRFDWRDALAVFTERLRLRSHSYARPNRRFASRIGEVPGRLRATRRPALLAVIDTSSSVEDEALSQIAAQISRIAAFADVTVVECDCTIQRVYPFNGRLEDVKGRGNTDLRPVFAPAFLATHRADGLVYFTDGDGPYPQTEPPIATLWIILGGKPFGCPWGRQVPWTFNFDLIQCNPGTRTARRTRHAFYRAARHVRQAPAAYSNTDRRAAETVAS